MKKWVPIAAVLGLGSVVLLWPKIKVSLFGYAGTATKDTTGEMKDGTPINIPVGTRVKLYGWCFGFLCEESKAGYQVASAVIGGHTYRDFRVRDEMALKVEGK